MTMRFPSLLRAPAARWIVLAAAAGAWLVPLPGGAQRRLPAEDPNHSRLKFLDSLTSQNTRCMVRKVKLNPRVRPVYVNRQPVGFC